MPALATGAGSHGPRVRSPPLRRTHRESKAGAKRFDAGRGRFIGSCLRLRSALTAKSRRNTSKLSVTPGRQRGRMGASSIEDDLVFDQFAVSPQAYYLQSFIRTE